MWVWLVCSADNDTPILMDGAGKQHDMGCCQCSRFKSMQSSGGDEDSSMYNSQSMPHKSDATTDSTDDTLTKDEFSTLVSTTSETATEGGKYGSTKDLTKEDKTRETCSDKNIHLDDGPIDDSINREDFATPTNCEPDSGRVALDSPPSPNLGIVYPHPSPPLSNSPTPPPLESFQKVDDTIQNVSLSQKLIKKPSRDYFFYHTVENARYSTTDPPSSDHYNEDKILALNLSQFSIFGVFDGHDGGQASSLLQEYFDYRFQSPDMIENLQIMNPNIVLRSLFLEAENKFFSDRNHLIREKEKIQERLPKNITSYEAYMFYPEDVQRLQEIEPELAGGSTAVVTLFIDGCFYVANVGDSRAYVVQRVENDGLFSEQLSTDHSVENPDELERLSELGLDIDVLKRNGRLGTQENTRSIGDYNIKKGYHDVDALSGAKGPPGIAEPALCYIDSSVEYLILMSDGVYKSLEALSDPPDTNTMPKLLQLIEKAETRTNDYNNIAAEVLEEIKILHEDTYKRNDPQSTLAVQCRKRDDMSLIIVYFGQKHNN